MRRKKSSSSTSSSSMETGERQSHSHRSASGGGGSELFICFTSRPSASSTSAGAAAPSLSASLSRRLKTSGSVKGAQSPMFTAVVGGRRNKGNSFETAEPSSPKVTCIGQVRVKGHKRRNKSKVAILRSRSTRVVGAEASFRRGDEMGREKECLPGGRNQGWVYQIPVSICEALKAVGSEFNCLLPCSGRSFCSSSSAKVNGEGTKAKRRGSCGAVFARWLMLQESEEAKRGQELEVEEEVEMAIDMEMERRKGELEMVVKEWEEKRIEEFEVEVAKKEEILVVGEEEEGRISVCIPPKNALLLMRCRSDPVRMAALANRLWGSPVRKVHVQEEEERDEQEEEEEEEEEDGELGSSVQNKTAVVEGEERERECEVLVSEEALCEAVSTDLEMQAEVNDQNLVFSSDLGEGEDPVESNLSSEKIGDDQCIDESEKGKECSHGEVQKEENEAISEEPSHSNIEPLDVGKKAIETEIQQKEAEEQTEQLKGKRSTSCSPMRMKEEKKGRHYKMRRQCSAKGGSSSREKEGRRHSFSSEGEPRRSSFSSMKDSRRSSFSMEGRRWSFSIEREDIIVAAQGKLSKGSDKRKGCSPDTELEKENVEADNKQEKIGSTKETEGKEIVHLKREETGKICEKEMEVKVSERKKKSGELPDCLLLMMYEPKLSMEVSRETWVRPTDFINWKSHRRQNQPKLNAASEMKEKPDTENTASGEGQKDAQKDTQAVEADNQDSLPPAVPALLPSLPPVVSATVVKGTEQNVKVELPVPAEVLYAPFVLKRCKSEPMRSSARLVADACFWKERHRPIGATGVGF
ncbi:Serine/Threonine-kinase pakA-like protein [Rhynchospora pubera]|uniref:Serine/Threonine-kinase pakA-like protein n=1 Tax=Rhynchospora pubera TaxID=906938 RepID=A0AAV8DVE4_9POAL|nr:Serine/Threonine-kinase pakA-like protein [Rhynchospora pubera]